MRPLMVLLTALLLIFVPAAAQSDTDSPRLRTAPPDEVFGTLVDLANQYHISLKGGNNLYLTEAVITKFEALATSPDIDFETRLAIFNYNGQVRWVTYRVDDISYPLIAQWIRDYQPDFSRQSSHTVGDLTIQAEPFDFNVDATPEWILDVTTESGQYRQRLFVAGQLGELKLTPSVLPSYGYGYHYSVWTSGSSEELFRRDLTGDGQPELIIADGLVGGWFQNRGRLLVLQWRGGKLDNIADISYSAPAGGGGGVFPNGVSLEYTDTDGNGTTEIIVREDRSDNWGCPSEWVTVYAWQIGVGKYLQRGETEVSFEDDAIGCILKNAHVAFWEDRYPDAIRDYQRLLNRAIIEELPPRVGIAQLLHARVKLAAAYAFMNQPHNAANTLDKALRDLTLETHDIAPIDEFVRAAHAAYQTEQSAIALCLAMYTTFQEYYRFEVIPDTYWGAIDYVVAPIASPYRPYPPNTARAGCDAPALIAASPDSPESQAAAETLRQADRVYLLWQLLQKGNDLSYRLLYPRSAEESEAERPASVVTDRRRLKDRLEIARADLEKFADDPAYGAVVRYHYAWALADAGFFDDSEVAAAYQSVIDFAPDSPWATLAALHVE